MLADTTTYIDLLVRLRKDGIKLWEENGKLRYKAPQGVLKPADLEELKKHKLAIIKQLKVESKSVAVVANPDDRFAPFPLTDVQSAYLLGRNEVFDYGGVACHIYLELQYDKLVHKRVQEVWNKLISRHEMLRSTIDNNGYQCVMENTPELIVAFNDVSTKEEKEATAVLSEIREDMGHRVYDTSKWPLFGIGVTQTPENSILHFSMEFLIADWASIWLLLSEFEALYESIETPLPELTLSFRDYLIAERGMRETTAYVKDKQYWMDRIHSLPGAPDLPLSRTHKPSGKGRFTRRFIKLDTTIWSRIKEQSQQLGLTPTTIVMTAYAAVIERWSRNNKFCLNLTVLNRLPLHEEVNSIVGDFTSVSLLEVNWSDKQSFIDRAKTLNNQLFDDLDHRLFSGVEVMREITRQYGRDSALMPFVFTSAIGLTNSSEANKKKGKLGEFGISQTPQVFIDCQAMDTQDGLHINWDIREDVFPDQMADDMFKAFELLLQNLVIDDTTWQNDSVVGLPDWQQKERHLINATDAPLPTHVLHEQIIEQINTTPDAIAVVDTKGQTTYKEIGQKASAVADALDKLGCKPQDKVAISMHKGANQVIAVLATLSSAGVYVPIDVFQPEERIHTMLKHADIRFVITDTNNTTHWPDHIQVIVVDQVTPKTEITLKTDADPNLPAYVIYTSGSTGQPKGVVINHIAAVNTIIDINKRFSVNDKDRVLALAQLGFDLSVFDIFGLLSVGGAIIYPDQERQTDPSHWVELLQKHEITIWNTVPALMQMLNTYLATETTIKIPAFRLALLSGDWIPLTLPDILAKQLPQVQLISLGGATEASIWSIHHVYKGLESDWSSIPYGRPLANQGFRVLDSEYRDCPVWAIGELYITGDGLADGYLNEVELTEKSFFKHPLDGQRLYRTGDLGRYTPGGEIEFLGREDNQVKIRGHRIELGEIESALLKHSLVNAVGVVVDGSVEEKALLGVIELNQKDKVALEQDQEKAQRILKDIEVDIKNSKALEVDAYIGVTLNTIHENHTGKQPLRVLQLGDTEKEQVDTIIEQLQDKSIEYVYTHTDKAIISELSSSYKEYENICFGVFDSKIDYRTQGLEPNEFDVVITTKKLEKEEEIIAIKEVCRPSGWLLHNSTENIRSTIHTETKLEILENQLYITQFKQNQSYVSTSELSGFLMKLVPEYMIPSHLQIVDALPITRNGKVDRKTIAKWRPQVVMGGTQFGSSDSVMDELETKLSQQLATALNISGIGRSQNFYDLGADSLIMAQVAGKLRDGLAKEETPVHIPYDAILRQMLNYPTIAALSEFIREKSKNLDQETTASNPENGITSSNSNGVLTPYGESKNGPLRVVFHAGVGTMNYLLQLLDELMKQDLGPIMAITVKDTEVYCNLEASELIELIAEDYAERLIETGHKKMQLIGYCMGGQIAVEVARRLIERDIEVVDLVLVDSHPVNIDVKDDLVIESLFVPNLGVSLEQAGFGAVDYMDMARAFMQIIEKNNGVIPEGAPKEVSGDKGLEAVSTLFQKLSTYDLRTRFNAYVDAVYKETGDVMEVEMAEGLYKMYRQSYIASYITPLPYIGDIRFLNATGQSEFLPGTAQKTIEYWREACLGEFTVMDIQGDHFTCIERPHLEYLIELITAPLLQDQKVMNEA
ncbi:non-ribosomal peptide synthetase [Aquimarina aquimarini]|uniref:non-ribosomal peptide synthetase n=1 Tax=Aquimarina aquimarini TaxID=1191734 RepID=UPI000D553E48|nr:non-ribosomal peptide synthetase [Aquimarina aquimarini]